MELKLDELINFCSYYTLTKNATELPHKPYQPTVNKESASNHRRVKVEVPGNKKTKKSKF
jgi:hypothetical protein